jgi:transcriptional regulator with XRE-family HTH domain
MALGGIALIAERIKKLRAVLRLTQADFGKRLGVSRDVINNLERARVEPKDVFLDHLCLIFGVRKQWLTNAEGEMFDREYKEDKQLSEAIEIFSALSPKYRTYALSQMKGLFAMQTENGGDNKTN